MRKLIAIAITLAVVAVAAPAEAVDVSGMSLSELQALLSQIQTTINSLTGSGSGVGVSCTFARNLYPGMTGTDVQCLQQYLNGAGHTVAATGVGSSGNETQYYGSLTQAAVGAWQDANGVAYGSYRGYFGPLSIVKYNALAVAGEEEEEEEEEEDGDLSGGEVSLLVTISATPATGVELSTTANDVAVAAFNAKATEADGKIERVDLNFDSRMWLYVDAVSLWVDGEEVASKDITSGNVTTIVTGSDYLVRFTGLNIIVREDETETITVKVDGSSLPAGTTSKAIIITFKANGVRAIDGAGVTSYEPSANLTTRTFTVKDGDTAELEGSTNDDNPLASTVQVNTTATTEDLVLLRHDLTAKYNDALISKVAANITAGSAAENTVFPTVYLYADDALLASTSTAANGDVAFDGWGELLVESGDTVTLTLKADVENIESNNFHEGESASVTIDVSADVTAVDATSYATATVSGSDGTGKDQHLFIKGLNIALVSTVAPDPAGYPTNNSASSTWKYDAQVKLNVSAFGGDMYLIYAQPASAAITAASSGIRANAPNAASSSIAFAVSSGATTQTYSWKIPSGQTKVFTVDAVVENTDSSMSTCWWSYVYIDNLRWMDGDTNEDGELHDWGLEDFKTTAIELCPKDK